MSRRLKVIFKLISIFKYLYITWPEFDVIAIKLFFNWKGAVSILYIDLIILWIVIISGVRMVMIIGLEGSANKIGIGIVEDGKVCILLITQKMFVMLFLHI